MKRILVPFFLGFLLAQPGLHSSKAAVPQPLQISGVYPHLVMWNDEKECGTGALVPWQGRLWAITYAPHQPGGSSDKLYEITPDLKQIIRPESVGGTPANRMIHRESGQLLIGPYLIDSMRRVRVIPPERMFGRLTGNARHLTDPVHRIYYATMEEGLYEVDLNTLEVTCLIRDGNGGAPDAGLRSQLPGYHGKGLYSGQGRLIYANNGEKHPDVTWNPTLPSGALAEWKGQGDWQLVRRHQFTEVTGPGGIYGSQNPAKDPIWTLGWDARSVVLGLLEAGTWSYYRLPKGSHSYDGSHGWNTEWPRIREIGESNLLATMHGTFWSFPTNFSRGHSSGVRPRSNYLKVIGDFCRWGDRVVLGCDDSAAGEFYNTRPFKAKHGAPKQSNSNLWFVEPDTLDHLGPLIGRGSVWLRDSVPAGAVSDPYLFQGYDYRQLHLTHETEHPVTFHVEVDKEGHNLWQPAGEFQVPAGGAVSHVFPDKVQGAWIRLRVDQPAQGVTAHFQYRNRDLRETKDSHLFDGLGHHARPAKRFGLMRSLAHDRLGVAVASDPEGKNLAYYEMSPDMKLVPTGDRASAQQLIQEVAQPDAVYTVDAASVLLEEDGKRYRLPFQNRPVDFVPAASPSKANTSLEDHLPQSLTRNAQVRVSGSLPPYSPEKAVDGSLSEEGRWIAPKGPGPKWMEIDFGQTTTVGNLWLVTGWKQGTTSVASSFTLQIRNGDAWETAPGGQVTANSQSRREWSFDPPITTSKLRISTDVEDFFRVYEVAAFQERPQGMETTPATCGIARVCREIATERDLLNLAGTFYELPARNAQGMAKVRPIASHSLEIHDFCSHNGLLLLTGLDAETQGDHIFRSEDGKAAVWAGVVDDLWQLGKPRGQGGPWWKSSVQAGEASDPYLMTGYDRKSVSLSSSRPARLKLEVDVDGTGLWIPYQSFDLQPDQAQHHTFPEGFSAYWVRVTSDQDTIATVQFLYE